MRKFTLIYLRRSIQFFVISVFILSPLFQVVRTFRQDPYPYPQSPVIQQPVIVDLLMMYDHDIRPWIESFSEQISGGPYTLHFFGFHFSEPLTSVVYSLTQPFEMNAISLQTLAIGLLIIFLLGRGYCGYVCPMSLLVGLNIRTRRFLGLRAPKYSGSLSRRSTRFQQIYIPASLLILLVNPGILHYILPPALMQHAWSDAVLTGSFTLWSGLFLLLILFEIIRPAFFCRRLCPTGTFLSLVGGVKRIRLGHVTGVDCGKGCFTCNSDCWLGLNPKKNVKEPACDVCGRCIPNCPEKRMTVSAGLIKSILVFSILSVTAVSKTEAGQWNDKEAYHKIISERTFYESKKKLDDSHVAYYSVYGNLGSALDFNLLILKKSLDMTHEEIVSSPIRIGLRINGKFIKSYQLDTVTRPISILIRSVYHLNFEYVMADKVEFEIESLSHEFSKFSVVFTYPKFRL